MRVLLITPPMTQLNTPYPATAYLAGFLALHAERLGLEVAQADLALELFLAVFSAAGLARLRAAKWKARRHPSVAHVLANADAYARTVDAVIRFLQGRDPSLAMRIASGDYLPVGPRFAAVDADGLDGAFGALGIADRAKHLASLYVDDLADAIREGVDGEFELARYGERLAASAPTFDPLRDRLRGPRTVIDEILDDVAERVVREARPDVVGLTAPFPGNVYGALRIAAVARRVGGSRLAIALGGGYVNTELRELSDARVFDYVDYITLDDGEMPFVAMLERLSGIDRELFRTFVRSPDGKRVVFVAGNGKDHDVPAKASGTPTYAGLRLDRYVNLLEMLNPMHRLWSDGRWNKLTIAHGCYWKQCAFCDITLDYIARYDRVSAALLVDRIEALIAETGQTGFHFVDEAAPPAGLRALAEELIARGVTITWWGNIRFEKAFTPELCALLARSGCVAVSGGLEVASDRLLAMMQKGVTVAQVARVTRAFADAGVMVHAYLMYGFPTETAQETLDALERVRQLFTEGCVQSAFWHRFTATAHSPIGQAPKTYGITIKRAPAVKFARNDLAFRDPTGVDHDRFAEPLRVALYNYMQGAGLDDDPRSWFTAAGVRMPPTSVDPDLVRAALGE